MSGRFGGKSNKTRPSRPVTARPPSIGSIGLIENGKKRLLISFQVWAEFPIFTQASFAASYDLSHLLSRQVEPLLRRRLILVSTVQAAISILPSGLTQISASSSRASTMERQASLSRTKVCLLKTTRRGNLQKRPDDRLTTWTN
ncbi:unnamed protein product [Protopolystoma xenopodis]|uniref:Uncharacterized protein n=1 Tax=Protopolystoma xenopodis TaxID=117903 RepID=A0A448WBW5_9PLAT|nr:unnamed protein product [Protopolystoma xenopodis]